MKNHCKYLVAQFISLSSFFYSINLYQLHLHSLIIPVTYITYHVMTLCTMTYKIYCALDVKVLPNSASGHPTSNPQIHITLKGKVSTGLWIQRNWLSSMPKVLLLHPYMIRVQSSGSSLWPKVLHLTWPKAQVHNTRICQQLTVQFKLVLVICLRKTEVDASIWKHPFKAIETNFFSGRQNLNIITIATEKKWSIAG